MSVPTQRFKEVYHIWHVENNDKASGDRVSVYMLYLNTVKEGGETEFLYPRYKD